MKAYQELAKQIVEKVGGRENVEQSWHCVTRLRFLVSDKEKIKLEEIKQLKGVIGAQFSGDQFQVIIGNQVADVFAEVEPLVGTGGAQAASGEKKGIISSVFDFISGVFTPLIPALAGAGLLKGFLAMFVTFGWLSNQSETYLVLNMIGDGLFYFLPLFLAVTAARKIKTNEYVALALAAPMLYPTMVNAVNSGGEITSFTIFGGITIPVINYSSSVIPIILGVILLKYVSAFVKSWMPNVLTMMFTPLLSLIIVAPITLWLIGPMGTYAGNWVASGLVWLFDVAGPLAGFLVAGFMPLLIMTGMHYALVPIIFQNFASYGFDPIVSPMMLLSNVAQAGAAFAVAVRSKNSQFKQLGASTGFSALLGITEPAMYGVNMKLKKPLYLAMISAGVMGGIAAWLGIKKQVLGGLPGLFVLPAYADPLGNSYNLIMTSILFVGALLGAFVLVMIFGFKDIPAEGQQEEKGAQKVPTKPKATSVKLTESATKGPINIHSPLKGQIVNLHDVSDPTFSEEAMGKGIAIEPDEDRIVSPVNGEVSIMPKSGHAIGIKGEDGEELLIHIGIETVSLKGKHFTSLVKPGDRLEIGQPLIEFDRAAIREAGLETVTMMIVTNTADYLDVLTINETGPIFEGERALTIMK
ncbi:PTS system beta-glucosides-specific IIC component [Paenibacillus amylolyticus]|uniref:PTS system beta-glucosides-specific IIC component n=1 Tax=Paenibacillus amylolyticus TaxID=1451 RepID=A0AAP5H5Y2_PAEAM|nr:beta-glucoside-specific PTS transporter subunit IIABC [Paenibacillus amylolyticus]MDR6726954.1 PTS system beta-glucosides-specific IIC component [Paenibacillus amylolyticus]